MFLGKRDDLWAWYPSGIASCVLRSHTNFDLPVSCLAGTCLRCKEGPINEMDQEKHRLEGYTPSERYQKEPYGPDNR